MQRFLYCLFVFGAIVSVQTLTVPKNELSRRAVFKGILGGAATAGGTSLAVVVLTTHPSASQAYERRDVGGENRSPETAAMNIQAYETQNRLEAEGFKLETQAEQKASLTAALADYAYSPTTSGGGNINKSKSSSSSSSKKSKTN